MAKKKSAFDRVPQRTVNTDQLNAQGLQLLQQGQFQAGADRLRQSLTHNPRQPEVAYNLGYALQQQGLMDAAVQAYGQTIDLAPQDVDALIARGHVLAMQKRFAEAEMDFAKAVKLAPQNIDAWNNYGNVLLELGRETDAIAAYDQALKLRPGFAQALFNKGKALGAIERYAESAAAYEAALAINPSYEEAKWHLSWVYLALGDFKRGWPLFEARWTVPTLGNQRRYPNLPQWLGQTPVSGKHLLLYAEQGLGDTLQFCRYVPILQSLGAKVSLAVQAPLVSLLNGQWPDVAVADSFADTSVFDLATPLMSLPLALGTTTLATIPADVPYLRVAAMTPPKSARPLVGLVWSGSAGHKNDKNRSIPVATLEPLFDSPVEWVSLQPDLRDADLNWLAEHPDAVLERPTLKDFAETARIITGLDLIVTVDTAVAHLAGALGKPVWILLPTSADYRWLLDRADSPWYPTARLFRQIARDDWRGVVAQVKQAITDTMPGSVSN